MQTDISEAVENQTAIVHKAPVHFEVYRFGVLMFIFEFPGQLATSRGCPRLP